MDFTVDIYKRLVHALEMRGYVFQTFEEFVTSNHVSKTIVLRHDVDRLPRNALRMALLERSMGVRASYFFRVVNTCWREDIIKEIASMGHEVAYHYEDLTLFKGVQEQAILHFEKQLNRFRQFYPSKTICMHGSPVSKWDNRKLWEKYDYRDYGIIAEPYFDVDYSKVFYITDTGRSWNNTSVSVRDVVRSGFDIKIKSTQHMIELIQWGDIPEKLIINTHPQRWFDPGWGWAKEWVLQNIKNVAKRIIRKYGLIGQEYHVPENRQTSQTIEMME